MDSKEYQEWVTEASERSPFLATANDGAHMCSQAPYLVIGLAGEAGEVADQIKKMLRRLKTGEPWKSEEVKLELGDTLWYLVGLANEFGWTLEDVMQANYDKITARRAAKKSSTD